MPIINKISLHRFQFLLVFSLITLATFSAQKIYHTMHARGGKWFFVAIVLFLCIIAITFGDLFISFHQYHAPASQSPEYLLQQNDIVQFLKKNTTYERIVGLGIPNDGFRSPLIPNTSMLTHLYDSRGYNPLAPKDLFRLAELSFARRGSFLMADAIFNEKLIDLMSTKYLICPMPVCPYQKRKEQWPVVYKNANLLIAENPTFLPRSFVAYDMMRVNDFDKAVDMLAADDFQYFSQIVIEDTKNSLSLPPSSIPRVFTHATITTYQPNHVTIRVQTEAPGVLVLTDRFDDGWLATVNQKEMPIYRANGIYRGVSVPTGMSEVVFTYWPKYFTQYILMSVAGLVLLLIGSSVLFIQNKPDPSDGHRRGIWAGFLHKGSAPPTISLYALIPAAGPRGIRQ